MLLARERDIVYATSIATRVDERQQDSCKNNKNYTSVHHCTLAFISSMTFHSISGAF